VAINIPAPKSRKTTCLGPACVCSSAWIDLPLRSRFMADEMLHMTSKIKHSGKMYLMKISIVYLLVCCVVFILGLLFIQGLFFGLFFFSEVA